MVKEIESVEEFMTVKETAGDKLLVFDFTASWCGPCKRIAPVLEELAAQYLEVLFYKIDVDEVQEVAAECGIRSMPTFQFYKCGKKIFEFSGADEHKLRENIEKFK